MVVDGVEVALEMGAFLEGGKVAGAGRMGAAELVVSGAICGWCCSEGWRDAGADFCFVFVDAAFARAGVGVAGFEGWGSLGCRGLAFLVETGAFCAGSWCADQRVAVLVWREFAVWDWWFVSGYGFVLREEWRLFLCSVTFEESPE
jgi:hypothetical protein